MLSDDRDGEIFDKMTYTPPYIELFEKGIMEQRLAALEKRMACCDLCPRLCHANRMAGGRGHCRTGSMPVVSSFGPHIGEERCLSGRYGSGTIFFTACNLDCIFCQNYDISHLDRGGEVSYDELAEMMLSLQKRGCHNINLVSPTHMVYCIVRALTLAVPRGLHLPIVYNTGGYDLPETLELLDGIIDIYMPDMKYMDPEAGRKLSGVDDYPLRAISAIREMHRQAGDLVLDERGMAYRGLLVRHLVLPDNLAATDRVMHFLANLSPDTYVNVMDQYRPEYQARLFSGMGRRVTLEEYDRAVEWAHAAGLHRLDRE